MLAIDQRSYDTLVAHARAEYPNEACALLGGRDHAVAKIYALPNAEASPAVGPTDSCRLRDPRPRTSIILRPGQGSGQRGSPPR